MKIDANHTRREIAEKEIALNEKKKCAFKNLTTSLKTVGLKLNK